MILTHNLKWYYFILPPFLNYYCFPKVYDVFYFVYSGSEKFIYSFFSATNLNIQIQKKAFLGPGQKSESKSFYFFFKQKKMFETVFFDTLLASIFRAQLF